MKSGILKRSIMSCKPQMGGDLMRKNQMIIYVKRFDKNIPTAGRKQKYMPTQTTFLKRSQRRLPPL